VAGIKSDFAVFKKECRTSDGIILWQKVFNRSGEEMRATTAVSVQRRRVKAIEVTVPANVLLLANYGDWTRANSDLPNDEVVLEGGGLEYEPSANVIIRRRLGALSMEDTRTIENRTRRYSNASYAIDVYQTASGDLESLDVRKLLPQA
jgi:hypothetical protein